MSTYKCTTFLWCLGDDATATTRGSSARLGWPPQMLSGLGHSVMRCRYEPVKNVKIKSGLKGNVLKTHRNIEIWLSSFYTMWININLAKTIHTQQILAIWTSCHFKIPAAMGSSGHFGMEDPSLVCQVAVGSSGKFSNVVPPGRNRATAKQP